VIRFFVSHAVSPSYKLLLQDTKNYGLFQNMMYIIKTFLLGGEALQ
jgi:hypothetical protein